MSEYRYVSFRAVDRPVSEKNLKYMHKQSGSAEISNRSFSGEYHFGDFGGNALEMLRRGFDLHFHYANFGTRTLMIRLPNGLPDDKMSKKYLDDQSLRFERDKKGHAGSLVVEPAYESDELEEVLDWDIEELMDRFVELRAEILAGDLRPLYLARLAIGQDMNHDPEEMMEGPAPAGLWKLTDAQLALAEIYGLSRSLVAAAAQGTPAIPAAQDVHSRYALWIRNQPTEIKDRWLSDLMSDPQSGALDEIHDAFRKEGFESWPTVRLNRSIAELQQNAEHIATRTALQAAEKAAR